MSDVDGDIS